MSTRKSPVLIVLILLLAISLMGTLVACGGDGGNTDKTTDSTTAKPGETTDKTEETTKKDDSTQAGNFTTEAGGLDWPSDNMGDLPKIDARIDVSMKADTGYLVSYSGVEKKDAENYVKELQDKGFASTMEMTTAEAIVYYGMNKKGDVAYFMYSIEDGTGTISFVPAA